MIDWYITFFPNGKVYNILFKFDRIKSDCYCLSPTILGQIVCVRLYCAVPQRYIAGVIIVWRTDNASWFLISTPSKTHTSTHDCTRRILLVYIVGFPWWFFFSRSIGLLTLFRKRRLDVLRLYFLLFLSSSFIHRCYHIQDNILYTLSTTVGNHTGSLDRKQRAAGYLLQFQIWQVYIMNAKTIVSFLVCDQAVLFIELLAREKLKRLPFVRSTYTQPVYTHAHMRINKYNVYL